VLEALGVRLDADPARCWQEAGIAFLFAPAYHPAFAHVAPIRRQLGMRTIFNMLGPLLNPALASRQLIGVRSAEYLAPVAQASTLLGTTHGFVVHGHDGLDEVSPCAATSVVRNQFGIVTEEVWELHEIGATMLDAGQILPGSSVVENASLIRIAISDADSSQFRAVLPSAAAAIWASGVGSSWSDGAARATESVQSGRAARTLTAWVEVSQIG
jgi:anthranilate phosphoribosyltransferase